MERTGTIGFGGIRPYCIGACIINSINRIDLVNLFILYYFLSYEFIF